MRIHDYFARRKNKPKPLSGAEMEEIVCMVKRRLAVLDDKSAVYEILGTITECTGMIKELNDVISHDYTFANKQDFGVISTPASIKVIGRMPSLIFNLLEMIVMLDIFDEFPEKMRLYTGIKRKYILEEETKQYERSKK